LHLSARFGDSVQFRIWDPRSLQGLIKAIRFGVHRYPTFVLEKHLKIVGLEVAPLEQALLTAGATLSQEQWSTPPL
jgi:hypothetical protein